MSTQGPTHFLTHALTPLPATALLARPKHASTMPARPTPNFFSAARRVPDWARLLVSSSNLLFIVLSCWLAAFRHASNSPEPHWQKYVEFSDADQGTATRPVFSL